MPTSMPARFSFSSFSAERDVPMTFAPRYLPACTPNIPTPDAAPTTSRVSPALSLPMATIAS